MLLHLRHLNKQGELAVLSVKQLSQHCFIPGSTSTVCWCIFHMTTYILSSTPTCWSWRGHWMPRWVLLKYLSVYFTGSVGNKSRGIEIIVVPGWRVVIPCWVCQNKLSDISILIHEYRCSLIGLSVIFIINSSAFNFHDELFSLWNVYKMLIKSPRAQRNVFKLLWRFVPPTV